MNTQVISMLNSAAVAWAAWMWPMAWHVALLALVVAVLTWLLRGRSARLRYALWLLVPIRLLLPPTLALATGWGWWFLPPAHLPVAIVAEPVAPIEPMVNFPSPEAERVEWRPIEQEALVRSEPLAAEDSGSRDVSPLATEPPQPIATIAISGRAWLFSGWLLGVAILSLRLLYGCFCAAKMVRRAQEFSLAGGDRQCPAANNATGIDVTELLESCRRRTGVKRAVRLCQLADAGVPMLIGFVRPTIILPTGLDQQLTSQELEAVLVHELQHVARHDAIVHLGQSLLGVVYFFHPLVWLSNRRLNVLREDACDEATVAVLEGQRRDYGAGIVKVAKLMSGPGPSMSLGIVESGSQVKRRLRRILDPRLPVGRRLSWSAFALLLLLAAVVLPVAARPGASTDPGTTDVTADQRPEPEGKKAAAPRGQVAEATGRGDASNGTLASLMTQEEVSAPDKAKREVADRNDESEFSGKVVDTSQSAKSEIAVRGVVLKPDGKPAVGAVVRATVPQDWVGMQLVVAQGLESPLSETIADSQGMFSIRFPRHPFGDVSSFDERWRDVWKKTQIAASLTGFGPTWATCGDIDTTQPLTLRLVEDLPLRGRVIDLEGRPIAGTSVKVSAPQATKNEDLSEWIAGVKAGEVQRSVQRKAPLSAEPRVVGTPTAVTTDADGRFEIRGLGRERIVSLTFAGEQVAYRTAQAVTRDMETLQQVISMPPNEEKQQVFGATFTFSAEPARTIEGIVKDAKTGEPHPGASVESFKLAGYPYSNHRDLKTTTDKNGRFRLIGMPKGAENRLWIFPNDHQPYFMRDVEVPDPVGLGPVHMEIELHRGIWIAGRVTDGATGAPVPTVRMLYMPFRANEFAQGTPEFHLNGLVDGDARQMRFQSKADGTYRIVGLPGRAIVAAESILKSYRHGVGYADVSGPKYDKGDLFDTYYVPMKPGPKWPNMMKEINPPADTGPVTLDFALDPGQSMRIHVQGPDGKPITGLDVHGISSRDPVEKTDDSELTVTNLGPDEQRPILFRHVGKRIGRVVRIGPAELAAGEITVKLQPEAYVVGRLLDQDGEPLSGAKIEASGVPFAYATRLDSVGADADGRFRAVLIPGCRYSLQAQTNRREMSFLRIERDLTVEPGETVDLGTIDITSDKRPEPVRTKAAVETDGAAAAADRVEAPQEFAGKVVDPAGKPAAGADLYLMFYRPQPTGLLSADQKPVATTDAEGAFRFRASQADLGVPPAERRFGFTGLVAVKEGFGFAWSPAHDDEISAKPGSAKPLKLVVDDQPIRGRIVDIEGRGVKNARLTLSEIWTTTGGDLSDWHAAVKEPKADYYSARMKTLPLINGPQVRSFARPAMTDADGRFTLRGVGRGRIAELLIEGPGIETVKIFARTEGGEKIELLQERSAPQLGSYIYYPAELLHLAGPSAPIIGTVRDEKSKTPLAAVTVKSQQRHGTRLNGAGADFVRAVTDAEGRYRLEGMPIGADNRLGAIAPRGEIPYLSQSRPAGTTSPDQPVEVDFNLRTGAWIEGRVTDKQTGHAIVGRFEYFVQQENPSFEFAKTLRVDERESMLTDNDGRFRLAALPGPGYVAFTADNHEIYPRADAILQADRSRQPVSAMPLKTNPHHLFVQNYHVVAAVDPAEGSAAVVLNLQLDAAHAVGQVVDPQGKPVTDYYYSGKLADFGVWARSVGDTFELNGYDPRAPRHVYFVHQQRDLAAKAILTGEPPGNFVVKLEPAGKIKGRLVAADGSPLPNHELVEWHPPIDGPEKPLAGYHAAPLPHNQSTSQSGQYETDADGRFEIACLAPNIEYRLQAIDRSNITLANGRVPTGVGPVDVIIRVAPGESKDLGDVRLADEKKFVEATKAAANGAALKPVEQRQQAVVTGRVTLPDGKPAAAAHVAVIATRIQPGRGGDLSPRGETLAEGATDGDGNYRLSYSAASSKTHRDAALIARQDRFAIAWKQFNLDAKAVEESLSLAAEEPIRGRLVDIEGKPAAGVPLFVRALGKETAVDGPDQKAISFDGRGQKMPAAWLAPVASDAEGRFQLGGIPAGQGVSFSTRVTERFAPQDIALNTGRPEQRGERDATYRSLVKNVAVGEEAVLPLAPAQWFEGQVTCEDTGQPVAHARLTIWASQQEAGGSMYSLAGQADADGRYRICPHPGVRFGINAYPPDSTPYLARNTRSSTGILWNAGDRVKQVDVTLARGVLVRGSVVETGTGTPVAGAAIQYIPEESNNPHVKDDILTGWQGIQLSDEQGKFEIAVLPGLGRLLVNAPNGKYVLRQVSEEELRRGKPGGRRNYAHAVERIEPAPGAGPIELPITLQLGATITGRMVDEHGKPVDNALVISRLRISALSLSWRGMTPPTLGGTFELSGLDPNEEYPVYFLDPGQRLGVTQVFRADSKNTTVVLEPCGQASARYVDAEGHPRAGIDASLHLVVTPGVSRDDWAAAKAGKLAADTDYVANIDRTNHSPRLKTDKQGRITFPALIPGATYQIHAFVDGKFRVLKDFSVKSGEQLDLGDISIDP